MLGVGGFGIVYLAKDHSLEREVALKEYMPASLAARGAGPQITVRSSSFAETYAIGLRSFVNEARLLARFDHPSLVKVYRFWEDNATAYMVMPFLQGVTLRDTRRRMAHPPDEAWIRSVITPILSALELLHREGVYHRDIAPDNILLPPDGPPVLLDFGAARRVISDRTQSLTAILKPSYAPIEQYAEMTQLRQGPWTDLYALGAVVHYLLFGAPPAPATARAVQDDADAIENRIVPGVSPRFLEAVSWMLAIRPNQRPQNGEQLRAVLDGNAAIPPRGRPARRSRRRRSCGRGGARRRTADASSRADGRRDAACSTAHVPTYMPTAQVAPPGAAPAADHLQPDGADAVARGRRNRSSSRPPCVPPPAAAASATAPPADWAQSRPATLPPPISAPTAWPARRSGAGTALAVGAVAGGRRCRSAPRRSSALEGRPRRCRGAALVVVARARLRPRWRHDGRAASTARRSAASCGRRRRRCGQRCRRTAPAGVAPTPVTGNLATPTPAVTATPGTCRAVVAPSTLGRRRPRHARRAPMPTAARVPPASGSRQPASADRSAAAPIAPASAAAAPARAPRPAGPAGAAQRRCRRGLERRHGQRWRCVPRSRLHREAERHRRPAAATSSSPAARPGHRVARRGEPVAGRRAPSQPAPVQADAGSPPARPRAREACGKRVFIALAVCMDERCEEPRFRNDRRVRRRSSRARRGAAAKTGRRGCTSAVTSRQVASAPAPGKVPWKASARSAIPGFLPASTEPPWRRHRISRSRRPAALRRLAAAGCRVR